MAIENVGREGDRLGIQDIVLQEKEREIVNIYIIGDFQQDYPIAWELSEDISRFLCRIPAVAHYQYDRL